MYNTNIAPEPITLARPGQTASVEVNLPIRAMFDFVRIRGHFPPSRIQLVRGVGISTIADATLTFWLFLIH
jgi:hypothetical protein